jgi:hypothetical protein
VVRHLPFCKKIGNSADKGRELQMLKPLFVSLMLFMAGSLSAAAGGSPQQSDEAGNPGPPWTRRPSIERAGPGGRAAGAAAVGTTKATTHSATEELDKLMDKKIRGICRGC